MSFGQRIRRPPRMWDGNIMNIIDRLSRRLHSTIVFRWYSDPRVLTVALHTALVLLCFVFDPKKGKGYHFPPIIYELDMPAILFYSIVKFFAGGYPPSYNSDYALMFPHIVFGGLQWLFIVMVIMAIINYRNTFDERNTIQDGYEKKYSTGFCHKCSYNLTGNTSGTCPECGTEIQS